MLDAPVRVEALGNSIENQVRDHSGGSVVQSDCVGSISTVAQFRRLNDLSVLLAVAHELAVASSLASSEPVHEIEAISPVCPSLVHSVRAAILAGLDPLGDAYCAIFSSEERRLGGQTFTPAQPVEGMFVWAESFGDFERLVDPGAGTGRYILSGLRRFPNAIGIASEIDPVVAVLLRANATVMGVAERLLVHVGDYRDLVLDKVQGKTLFIGNPPYVRHHGIAAPWKKWYSDSLKMRGYASSQLAGLHLHFFVKTLQLSSAGDVGCFLTAAEWLDAKYGQSMRDMMVGGLGGRAVFVVAPDVQIFGDAMVSACITCFSPGGDLPLIEFKALDNVEQILDLSGGHLISRALAKSEVKWTSILRQKYAVAEEGFVKLGELFKVSRGQVTGKNCVWVTKDNRFGVPDEYLIPTITDAADITGAAGTISDATALHKVISLPSNLAPLSKLDRVSVDNFLEWARSQGGDRGWTAEHRTPWWRVDMSKVAAEIVVTYMGRRPPVFAVNAVGAKLINVAHGLYPRVPVSPHALRQIVAWLNVNVSQDSGRVYAGGLTKFEPSEIENLWMPSLDQFEKPSCP